MGQSVRVSGGPGATVGAFSSRPAAAAGVVFVPTDGGYLQASDGTNWYNVVSGVPMREPPAVATIATQTNFGTSTLTKTSGVLVFTAQKTAGPNVRTAGKSIVTLSGSSCTVVGNVNTPAGAASGVGPYFRESSTGKIYSACLTLGASGYSVQVERWTSATARGALAEYILNTRGLANGMPIFLRVAPVSTNMSVQISFDGSTFSEIHSTVTTTAFTTAANEFGLAAHVENVTTDAVHVVSYLAFVGD